jgi:hypothetical protein
VDGGAWRNAVELAELVESEAQRGENFKVEFGNGLRRSLRDFFVESGAPAQDAHDQFRR